MTKKDYELVARVLRMRANEIIKARPRSARGLSEIDAVAIAFADELAKDDSRFKRDVFLRACGVES